MGDAKMDNKQPLHTCIPRWITSIVETKKCYKCNSKVNKKDICAVGIRMFGKSQSTVYVEHTCSKCKARTVTSFAKEKQASVEDLCYMLIEQIHNKRRIRKSQELKEQFRGDQIEDEEVATFIDFMNKAESFDDVMKFIGSSKLPPEPPPKTKEEDES